MGRKRKNEFEESSIRFEEGTGFQLSQVKTPYFVNATLKIPISEDKNGEKLYGETTVLIKKDISEKDEVIEAFQKTDYEVIKIEEFTIPIVSTCPKCNSEGIPKIESQSNKFDFHYRSETDTRKTFVGRPNEYWLCYNHEKKPYKCRIAKCLATKNSLTFKKNGKTYYKIREYTLPKYVKLRQNELIAFDSFRKFFNTSHA